MLQLEPLERRAVVGERHLVLGATIEELEHALRKSFFRDLAQVEDVVAVVQAAHSRFSLSPNENVTQFALMMSWPIRNTRSAPRRYILPAAARVMASHTIAVSITQTRIWREILEFVRLPLPLFPVGRGCFFDRNIWPDFRVFGVQ